MLKIVSFGLALVLSAVPAYAEELSADAMIRKEYEQDKNKINEIFEDKIQKITARVSLPDEMRSLLISQAAEVRQFDLEVLQKKRDLKLEQARKRDELKDSLRRDAENRALKILQDEENFRNNADKNGNTSAPDAGKGAN